MNAKKDVPKTDLELQLTMTEGRYAYVVVTRLSCIESPDQMSTEQKVADKLYQFLKPIHLAKYTNDCTLGIMMI